MPKNGRLLIVLFFFFQFSNAASAFQDPTVLEDSLPSDKKVTFLALPLVFYAPETNLGFGAAGLAAFRLPGEIDSSLVSQVQFGVAYTLLNQLLVYFPYRINWGKGQYTSFGEVGYYRYVYRYFGIGNSGNESTDEWYDAQFPRIRFNLLKKIAPDLFLGGSYWFDQFAINNTEPGGALEMGNPPGAAGGVTSGLGPTLIYDSRDLFFYPSKGAYLETKMQHYPSWLGSDFVYQKFSIDYSRYFTLNSSIILAVNTYHELNFGDVPFHQMAMLGGPRRLRGYFEGIYRDKHMSILQAEFRGNIYKRLGWAAFGGTGIVAAAASDYKFQNLRPAGGAGLRFAVDTEENINIRMDFGVGQRGTGFYLTVAEAF